MMDDRRDSAVSDPSDVIERMDGMIMEERQLVILREPRRRCVVEGGGGGEESKHITALLWLVGRRSVIARKPEVKSSE
jgi:hypothetical protein